MKLPSAGSTRTATCLRLFVTCCAGTKIICYSRPSSTDGPHRVPEESKLGAETGHYMVDACTLEHERRHAQGQGWTTCNGRADGLPPDFEMSEQNKLRSTCEHCRIYSAQVECLRKALEDCRKFQGKSSLACVAIVEGAMRDAVRKRDGLCAETYRRLPRESRDPWWSSHEQP